MLLFFCKAGKIIFFFVVKTRDLLLELFGHGTLLEEFGPGSRAHCGDQAIRPKRLFVEETGSAEMRVQLLVVGFVKDLGFNPQVSENFLRHVTVFRRALNGLGSAVAQQQASSDAEFVAASVSTKIVVIIKNQNAQPRPVLRAEEESRQHPADAASDDP